MQWSNSLKRDVLNFMAPYEAYAITHSILGTGVIAVMDDVDGPSFTYDIDYVNNKYKLKQPIMIPITAGRTINNIKIYSFISGFIQSKLLYEIILEGDEIKEFPNGGALVIENLEINLIFE